MRLPLLAIALSGCTLLTEQRTDPTSVYWSGWVLADLPTQGTTPALDAGTVDFTDLDGNLIASADQPYADSPGWWEVEVPIDTDVAVRVEGSPDSPSDLPALAPMVWRGHTPDGRGVWLQGALFARDLEWLDTFFSDLSSIGLHPGALADGEVAHLWGEPLDPDAWAGATIEVTGDDGQPAQVLTFTVDDDGAMTEARGGRVDIFLAINLPPGITSLHVEAVDRSPLDVTWPTRGGDLLSAVYIALPEND